MDANVAWGQISVGVKMACGAREVVGGEDGLHFRVGSTRKLQKIVIKLNGHDLYDVALVEIKRPSYDVVTLKSETDVYAEDLSEIVYSMVNK